MSLLKSLNLWELRECLWGCCFVCALFCLFACCPVTDRLMMRYQNSWQVFLQCIDCQEHMSFDKCLFALIKLTAWIFPFQFWVWLAFDIAMLYAIIFSRVALPLANQNAALCFMFHTVCNALKPDCSVLTYMFPYFFKWWLSADTMHFSQTKWCMWSRDLLQISDRKCALWAPLSVE